MTDTEKMIEWLRTRLRSYRFDAAGVVLDAGTSTVWPVTFADSEAMYDWLRSSGQLMPLPQEPAALANILENSLFDFIEAEAGIRDDVQITRGTERGYPDLEIEGTAFGGHPHAIDIKVARRNYKSAIPTTTQSRITLYTGNTYFKRPDLHWPGTIRPFSEYASHLDVVLIYTFDKNSDSHIADPEIIVHESWRIASKKRSSTTREYIGAVQSLADLRSGSGEFASAEEFYQFWRRFNFKISPQVSRQLDALLRQKDAEISQMRTDSERNAD